MKESETPELARLSHQLNNLLMIIQGNLDLIRMNSTSPEKVASFAETASDALERCTELTDQLSRPSGPE
jgi:signal transduction histidine kinase